VSLNYLHIQHWDLQQTTYFATAVTVSVAATISPWFHWLAATAPATDAMLIHLAHLRHFGSFGFLLLQPQVKVYYSNFVYKTYSIWDIRLQKCVTLQTGLRVRQGRWRCHHSIERMRLPNWHSIVWLYIVYFWMYSMSKNIATLNAWSRSVKVNECATIRYIWYRFLLAFYSNFDPKTHRFFRYLTS